MGRGFYLKGGNSIKVKRRGPMNQLGMKGKDRRGSSPSSDLIQHKINLGSCLP